MLGRLGGWRPLLAALSVVLSALIGVATNVVTEGGTVTLVVAVGGLVGLAAGLAWFDSRPRPGPDTIRSTTLVAAKQIHGANTMPSPDVLGAEVARIARTPTLLVVCVYDGTLVHETCTTQESLAALERLARLTQTVVAVISGRTLRDLVALSRLSDRVRLVGSHGAEFDLALAESLPAPLRVVPAHDGQALDRLRAETNADAVMFIGNPDSDGSSLTRLREGDLAVGTVDPQGIVGILELLVGYRRQWLDSARAIEIERHSLLAGGGSVALLTPEARLSWLCHPRPHSAAVFADLLGGPAAGHFSIGPAHGGEPLQQRYLPGTVIVETRWPGLTVTDWLDGVPGQAVLFRLLRGQGIAHVEFAPRPEFGRLPIRLQPVGDGLLVLGSNQPMALRADGVEWQMRSDGGSITAQADIDLSARGGQVELELRLGTDDLTPHPQSAAIRLSRTASAWTAWADGLKLPTIACEEVRRAALTIRALWYPSTGAMLAAATTSLPQNLGGARNWDYRYCWLRDAAICARALVCLGSHDEAESLLRWIDLRSRAENGNLARLRPVYTVDGEDIPAEATIDELAGYAGSRPVRVGNGAYRLLPLDVFGFIAELIAALAAARTPGNVELALLHRLVQTVQRHWHEPDHGFWEIRLPPRHHVHSKAMCWLTVDRALRVHSRLGLPQPQSWLDLRERIAGNVLARGWDTDTGAFTAAYGVPTLDTNALWVGLSGLVGNDDPRFRATVTAIDKQLRSGPAVRPYHGGDHLPGSPFGFHLGTSWLIEALIRTGQQGKARDLFSAMLSCLGPTGLLSEGYDPLTERGAGNHPQAFSHAGLIQAALALDGHR